MNHQSRLSRPHPGRCRKGNRHAVNSGTLDSSSEVHRVVAQIAGHDRVADGSNY